MTAEKNTVSSSRFNECINVAGTWAYKRVPNFQETLTLSTPVALVGTFAEPFIEMLYQINPASKTVLRNGVSIFSTLYARNTNKEIGGTGVKYDIGHVWGNIAITIARGIVISTAYAMIDRTPGSLEKVALYTSIFEPLPRLMNLLSEKIQREQIRYPGSFWGDTKVYYEYACNNITAALVRQATVEAFAKSVTATLLGGFMFGNLQLSFYLREARNYTANKFLSLFVDSSENYGFLAERCASILNSQKYRDAASYAAIAAVVACDGVLKIAAEVITSYAITPTVRIAQDLAGEITKRTSPYLNFDATAFYKQALKIPLLGGLYAMARDEDHSPQVRLISSAAGIAIGVHAVIEYIMATNKPITSEKGFVGNLNTNEAAPSFSKS